MEISEASEGPSAPVRAARWAPRAALLALIGMIVAIVFLSAQDKWFSDAHAPQDTSAYDKLLEPAIPAPTSASSNLTNVVVVRTNGRVRVTYPDTVAGKADFYGFETVRVKPNEAVQLTEGGMRARYLGVAHGEVPPDDYSRSIEGRFFELDGRPMSLDEIKKIHQARRVSPLSIQGRWPEIRIAIEAHPREEYKILSARLYDARTRHRLAGGHSSRAADPNFKIYDFEMKRWHGGPVELILDVAYGPAETSEMPAQPGSSARVGNHDLHLLAADSGSANGSSMGGGGNGESYMSWTIEDKSRTNKSTFGFVVFPSASSFPADVAFLVKGEIEPQSSGSHSSSIGLILTAPSPLEDVRSVHITRYPNARRVIFEIPRIPGLPEENDAAENLFDIRIPSARIRNASELERYIESAVQLEFENRRPSRPTPPPGYFPRVFRDTTPRELTLEYLKMNTNTHNLRINPERHRIEFLRPWHDELLKRIREGLKK